MKLEVSNGSNKMLDNETFKVSLKNNDGELIEVLITAKAEGFEIDTDFDRYCFDEKGAMDL